MLGMLLCLATALAQNKQVTGRITDINGGPVAGISVKVKGAKGGVTSDASGNYSISVPPNAILQFTGIGFEAKEVDVSNLTSADVK